MNKLTRSEFKRNCGHSGVVHSRSSEVKQAIAEHKEYMCADCVMKDTKFMEELCLRTAYLGE